MNPKIIFDFIGKKNPKYELENIIKFYGTGMYSGPSERNYTYDVTEKLFKFINDPSEELQLSTVSTSGVNSIQYIENPTEKVQYLAVNGDPYTIKHIKNPTEKVKLRAIEQTPYVIEYIKNPSEEIQLKVINRDAVLIQFINNPTEEVQLKVLDINPDLFKLIINPTNKVKNIYKEILNEQLEIYKELLTRRPDNNIYKEKLEKIIEKLKELDEN
jgi:hypothetical protein